MIHLEPNHHLKYLSKRITIKCPVFHLMPLTTSTKTRAALKCYYLLLLRQA